MTTATQPQSITTTAPSLDSALAKCGLAGEGLLSLRSAYAPIFDSLQPLVDQAREILPTDAKGARALRLKIKDVRVSGDHQHKQLKADILLRGRAIDGMQSVLDFACKPVESALQAIEEAEARAEAARKAKLQQDRAAELRPFMSPDHIDLGSMADDAWQLLLSGARTAHQNKLDNEAREKAQREAEERRAAEERARKAEADRIERERIAAENERLRQENAAREAELAKEREAQRIKDEAAAAERKKLADAAAKAEAEAKRLRQEQEEKERQEKAAKRRLARAPDKVKIKGLADRVRQIEIPHFTSEDGAAVGQKISEQLQKFAAWLEVEAEKLS
jgi:hypothetical protein